MASGAISSLFVELSLKAENFNNGLRDAQKEAKEFEKTISPSIKAAENIGKAMTGAGVAISAVGVPFAVLAKSAIDTADEFDEMAARTGASVEALSAVSLQAKMTGTDMGSVEMAFRRSSKVMEEAETGNKGAAESLAKLGLSVAELSAMTPDQRFFAMAKGLAAIDDDGTKSAVAMEVWGKSGTALIPMLGELAKGQGAVTASAAEFGSLITTKAAKDAGLFNDSLDRLASSFKGIFQAMVASGLLEKLTDFANRVASVVGEFTSAHPRLVAVVAVLGGLAAVIGPLLVGFGLMLTGIAPLIAIVTSLSATIATAGGVMAALAIPVGFVTAVLTGPVGIAIAIGVVIAALTAFALKNEAVRAALSDAWDAIKNAVGGVLTELKGLFDVFAPYIHKAWDIFTADILGKWKIVSGVLGPVLSVAFDTVKVILSSALNILGGAIRAFTGLITGDWGKFSEGIERIWSALWDAIKRIITAPLDAVKGAVSGFTGGVTGYFKGMYDAVVGNSFVPDLMDRIQEEFGRLPGVMESPAFKATQSVMGSFSSMFDTLTSESSSWVDKLGSIFSGLGGGGGAGGGLLSGILGKLGLGGGGAGDGAGGVYSGDGILGVAGGGGGGLGLMGMLGPLGMGFDIGHKIAKLFGLGEPSEQEKFQKAADEAMLRQAEVNRASHNQWLQMSRTGPGYDSPLQSPYGAFYGADGRPGPGLGGSAIGSGLAGGGGITVNVYGSVTSEENLARTLMRKFQELSGGEGFVLQGAR